MLRHFCQPLYIMGTAHLHSCVYGTYGVYVQLAAKLTLQGFLDVVGRFRVESMLARRNTKPRKKKKRKSEKKSSGRHSDFSLFSLFCFLVLRFVFSKFFLSLQ